MKGTFFFHFIRREAKQIELKILMSSAFIALLMVFVTVSLLKGISLQLAERAHTLMGGELILESPYPLSENLIALAEKQNLRWVKNTEFFTMVNADQQFILAQVSSFNRPFPLIGHIALQTEAEGVQNCVGPPLLGEVWVSESLLAKLDAKLGSTLTVGEENLTITGIMKSFPLLLSRTTLLSPILYVNAEDVPKMGVVKPGSQINYRLILSGSKSNLAQFLTSALVNQAGIKIVTLDQGRETLSRPFKTLERYIGLILVLQMILSSIAIAICTHVYANRQIKWVGILRTLGARFNRILGLYLLVMGTVASAMMLLAIGAGGAILKISTYFLSPYGIQPIGLQMMPIVMTLGVGILLVIGMSLPPLLGLKSISPIQMKQPQEISLPLTHIWIYGIVGVLLLGSLCWMTQSVMIPLRLLSQFLILGGISFGLAWLVWRVFAGIRHYANHTLRIALQGLIRLRGLGYLQWIVYTLLFMIFLLIEIIQVEFLETWQQQLPPQTPNYFLIDIQEGQRQALDQWFEKHGLDAVFFYPVIRATFTHINGIPVSTYGTGREDPNAPRGLNRAINLTWLKVLPQGPQGNEVIGGVDWSSVSPGSLAVSVEQNFANQRNIKLGDMLSFLIDNKRVTAKVVQLRSVHWQSFKPNFFVIFPEEVLEGFPASYITSFYLDEAQKPLLVDLSRQFQEISLIDLDAMIQTMQTMIRQFARILEGVLMVMLITGFLLMQIILQAFIKVRLHESALLKILGVPKGFIKKIILIEYGLFGALCGMVAGLFAQGIAYDLGQDIFNIYYTFELKWVTIGAVGGGLLLMSFSLFGFRKVFQVSPLLILRQSQ